MLRRYFVHIAVASSFYLISIGELVAQQIPALSTYAYNLISVNPAYSGYYQTTDISIAAQTTVPNIEGAPQVGSITLNGFGAQNMGAGGGISYDQIGVTSTLDMYASYAYKIVSRNHNSYTSWGFYPKVLSFGVQAGLSNVKEDLTSLGMTDDPNFAQSVNTTTPYFGAGLFFSKNHFYLGLSAPRLYHTFHRSSSDIQLNNHYYFQGGFQTFLGERDLVKTAVMARYVEGAPVQFDLNVILAHNNLLEVGAGYRSTSGINLLAGVRLYQSMRLIYYFNLLSLNSSNFFNNTTGILLSIRPLKNFKY